MLAPSRAREGGGGLRAKQSPSRTLQWGGGGNVLQQSASSGLGDVADDFIEAAGMPASGKVALNADLHSARCSAELQGKTRFLDGDDGDCKEAVAALTDPQRTRIIWHCSRRAGWPLRGFRWRNAPVETLPAQRFSARARP